MAEARHFRVSDHLRDVSIGTYTGRLVHPLFFRKGEIEIEDIAASLSHAKEACRFRGHVQQWYCVAQHSVEVARLLEGQSALVQLTGLLHDASEAYLPDLARPWKQVMRSYKRLDGIIQRQIYRFYLGGDPSQEHEDLVHWADNVLLVTEARDLMRTWDKWVLPPGIEPLPHWRGPIAPEMAWLEFMEAFGQLQAAWGEEQQLAEQRARRI